MFFFPKILHIDLIPTQYRMTYTKAPLYVVDIRAYYNAIKTRIINIIFSIYSSEFIVLHNRIEQKKIVFCGGIRH